MHCNFHVISLFSCISYLVYTNLDVIFFMLDVALQYTHACKVKREKKWDHEEEVCCGIFTLISLIVHSLWMIILCFVVKYITKIFFHFAIVRFLYSICSNNHPENNVISSLYSSFNLTSFKLSQIPLEIFFHKIFSLCFSIKINTQHLCFIFFNFILSLFHIVFVSFTTLLTFMHPNIIFFGKRK